ncbi:AMP-binding protein [Hydrogenophaga sp. BPS33]|uniref:AMP-binding protein n=1 Tax=Hydrogenophaga sp. BPS33 TaxID=2651974 RepID=UPI00132028B1|nr:AMP-binding protein [Hydrogenophaga sp. BPS33]QHE83703.1 long-chain fatty acid--CoA ligase [Hydrogenophaga sp. BPS33]
MNVAEQLHRCARLYTGMPAAICGEERRSVDEIEERSNRLANALLAGGLVPGDRVASWLENSIRCVELDFALAKAGLVRVSLNPRLTPREARIILEDSEARAIVYGASFDAEIEKAVQDTPACALMVRADEGTAALDGVRGFEDFLDSGGAHAPGIEIDDEAIYCLFYTSGTTGKPKGVMLSHRAILHVCYNLLMEVGPLALGEKVLLMQPLSHGSGFFVLPQFMKGGVSVIQRQFDAADALRLTAEHEIEVVKLIPTMLQRLLRVPGVEQMQFPKLRAMIYGASPMPAEPLRRAIEVFGAKKLVQIYGQSECPVTLSILPAEEHQLDQPHPERLISAGRPWTTMQMRVVDEDFQDVPVDGIGEVVLRGPQMMSGYWRRDDLTREVMRGDWLKTRDMGRVDAHGFVYLLGRKDEMIISGGYNIAPREVEDVLYEHASVQEAAVVGETDAEWGQSVAAYVVFRDADAAKSLLAHGRERLGFKRPKRVYVMNELPKNAAGKIQKSALKPELAIGQLN